MDADVFHSTARAAAFRGRRAAATLLILIPLTASAAGAVSASGLTQAQRSVAVKIASTDSRTRELLGPGEPTVVSIDSAFDKTEADAFLSGQDPIPAPRATVLLWNRATGKAARVTLSGGDAKAVGAEAVRLEDVPLMPDEVDQALTLAQADAAVKEAIGASLPRFRMATPGAVAAPYSASALPLRSSDPKDPCATHRCLDLIFRVEQGFLPLRVEVDLTLHSVRLEGPSMREEGHP